MVVFYLEALAAIAVALSVLMAGAWAVQQRGGNSGWVAYQFFASPPQKGAI
jgi:steroid 5-alpha reductase family enzyme